MLRAADQFPAGSRRAEQLNASILAAAAPLLDERAAPQRTLWDYADRWASMLLPIGALTAIAAGVCLFVLASHPAASNGMPPVRVALLGAATNRMSSQSLVDFLVTGDAGLPPLGRRVR